MGTTLDGIDIVHIRIHILSKVGIVQDCHLYWSAKLLRIQVNHLANQRSAVAVDITNKLAQTILRVEHLALVTSILVLLAAVGQTDTHTCIQVCQLTHTVGQDLVLIHSLSKDTAVRPELYSRTCAFAFSVCANHAHRSQWLTSRIILCVDLTITTNLYVQFSGECIHTAHTHTVQTARHLVAVLVELTTSVQYGHYHLQRALLLFWVNIHRNTTTVILYGDRVILVDDHFDIATETCQCLVNRVIHHLIYQVVKTLLRDIANIHRRAFTHCL